MMTINEAIYKVISTQFKKDMGVALKIVEDAGYKVYKWHGNFVVKNERTGKDVSLGEWYRGYTIKGNDFVKCKFRYDTACLMDLVGYLEKPFNTEWYDLEHMRNRRSLTWIKYDNLCEAKKRIGWNNKDIAEAEVQIERLKKRIETKIKERAGNEKWLADLRKEYGLA